MWNARSLTLFGRVLMGLRPKFSSRHNLRHAEKVVSQFYMEKRKDKIKRTVLYQNLEKDDLRMTHVQSKPWHLHGSLDSRMLEKNLGALCQATSLENRSVQNFFLNATMTQSIFPNCQPSTRTFSSPFKN